MPLLHSRASSTSASCASRHCMGSGPSKNTVKHLTTTSGLTQGSNTPSTCVPVAALATPAAVIKARTALLRRVDLQRRTNAKRCLRAVSTGSSAHEPGRARLRAEATTSPFNASSSRPAASHWVTVTNSTRAWSCSSLTWSSVSQGATASARQGKRAANNRATGTKQSGRRWK